jgi:hypothetical protein
MHPHRVVGGDGAVQKAPVRLPAVLLAELVEDAGRFPEGQNFVFAADEPGISRDFFEHSLDDLVLQ